MILDVTTYEDVLEKDVKKQIKAYLKSIDAYQFWPVQTGFGVRTVDCLGCHKGRFFAIEVKRSKGGRLTRKQSATLHEVLDTGGMVIVASSVGDVKIWLF